ncbi:nucleotidyltransferase domain-containing protein [Mycobacterium adipatum]|uniref:nucleotidyltransferase domain-containing protein n=1 Tax=Mycobacterium adipatum TaxID=1682113 RepID=UPI0034E0C511
MQLNRPFATVTPTLDGDVLAVLATVDEPFTLSQINRILTTASAEGIRKVLGRLTTQGVVLRSQVGRTNLYRLNTNHIAAEPILALSRLASTLWTRIESLLESWADPPIYAAVFGSAAKGLMTIDSDIDLFLVRRPISPPSGSTHDHDIWASQVTDLARAVTVWTGNDTRVVEYAVDDLRTAAEAGEPLLDNVARHGLTVAGSHAWLNQQLHPPTRKA